MDICNFFVQLGRVSLVTVGLIPMMPLQVFAENGFPDVQEIETSEDRPTTPERDVAGVAPIKVQIGRAKDESELQVLPEVYVPEKKHTWERKPFGAETTSED